MTTPRLTVADERQFLMWAARAPSLETVTYHVGNLAADRAKNHNLHLMAEAALLLTETGWLTVSQTPLRSSLPLTCYFATRTKGGKAPRGVMLWQITAPEYRALRAVRDADPDQSAVRAIRDGLGYSEDIAADYLALLFAKGFVERADDRGWQPSSLGLQMLL